MNEIFGRIAEAKIQEAIRQGQLKDLPGEGKPLILENPNPFEDPEERMANKIMKNLGLVPEEVELRKEIHALQQSLAQFEKSDEEAVLGIKKKLEETTIRYNVIMEKKRRRVK